MGINDVEIKVIERQELSDATSVDYHPFGVKVLKLGVRRRKSVENDLPPLWIRPEGYQTPDLDSQPHAFGRADDDEDLWVAWGAGDEAGFAVNLADKNVFEKESAPITDDTLYHIYLHLIHRPADPLTHQLNNKTLTVVAADAKGDIYGKLTVQLTTPQNSPNPVRTSWAWNQDNDASTLTFQGVGDAAAQLPRLVARWWPSQKIVYEDVDAKTAEFLSQLKIIYKRQADADRGQLTCFHGDLVIADIAGDIRLPIHDQRLCAVDLFRFPDDHHIVIRVWFYWLHLTFSTDELTAFAPAEHLSAWQAQAGQLKANLDSGSIPWHIREEVPDLERFDLILDPDNLRLQYVGSDAHWKEFWAEVDKGETLQARIATKRDIPAVVWQNWEIHKSEKPIYNPLENGLCDLVNEWNAHECPHRGEGKIIKSRLVRANQEYDVCQSCLTHFRGQTTKAVGKLWGKHAPILENATILKQAISSKVTSG